MALKLPVAGIRPSGTLTTLLLILLVGTLLLTAKAVLIPISLAVLLTFLLGPPVTRLQRLRVPKIVAVILVVGGSLGILAGITAVVSAQLINLADELPRHEQDILQKVQSIKALREGGRWERLGRMFTRVEEKLETDQASGSGDSGSGWFKPIPVEVSQPEPSIAESLQPLALVAEPLATAGLVIVLVLFLLLKREDLRNRLVTLSGHSHLAVTTKALDEAGRRIGRYLLMQFLINCAYGATISLGLVILQVPYAALWGVAAAVLRYIPYVGPIGAAALPIAYSLLTSTTWIQPIEVVILIVVMELVTNNVLEPWLYGRNVGVSEVAVILSAVFWGWLWGPVGLVLATPLTVCLVVAGRYVPALAVVTRILGDDPDLDPHVVYYQRLLAKDEDEAAETFEDYTEEYNLADACARILIPALVMTKRDRARGVIEPSQEAFILASVAEHLEEAQTPAVSPFARGEDAVSKPEESSSRPSIPREELPLVLGYGVRDAEDETALQVLARLVEHLPMRFEILSRQLLLSEMVAEVNERQPAALCLLALPPGGTTHARTLHKRFAAANPNLKIVFGRWGGNLSDRQRTILREQGFAYLGSSPADTVRHLLSLARLKWDPKTRSPQPTDRPAPHPDAAEPALPV